MIGSIISISASKLAVAVLSTFMFREQIPPPLQSPLQPVKVEPGSADAVRVIGLPPSFIYSGGYSAGTAAVLVVS